MRCLLAVAALLTICTLAGCGKKSLTKKETRAITAEIVDAAQKITAHKSEIAIRPELQPSSSRSASGSAKANGSGALVADSIFVTLSDSSQLATLRQSLGDIARRHKLQLSENSSGGVQRFDLAFDGNRTQTIHVVTPLAARERSSPSTSHGAASPRLAIILDDLGYERSAADELLALPFPLTVSVLPHLPLSSEVAEEAFRRGDQVLLHLPMESEADGAKPEEIELRVGMNSQQVESALEGMLETVPHAIGVNNHQGSRATSDPVLMAELMPALRQRGLFFVDSRTAASTVAYDAAERAGVRAASRKVFLDDTATREAVLAQLDLAARDAARDGVAIAIGHPRPATIAALTEGVPRVEARGIRLVFVSDVVR
jgi:polysaccharide deacetylase 2 family uncharacterized protein YibQ